MKQSGIHESGPSRGRSRVPIPRRLIARLDIKGPNLVKGIQLEGLRVIGDPSEHALAYYRDGIDELIYMDVVASLYGRNNLVEVVESTAEEVFVPLTVGGGVRSMEDVHRLLRAGADKVAINTGAVHRPALIAEVSRRYGSQCVVLSVEAKRRGAEPGWEAYTDGGRERSGVDVLEWVEQAIDLGAGEIMLTSVDKEGTRKGFDVDLIEAVAAVARVPLIVSGGAGSTADIAAALDSGADAVAVASLLHYRSSTIAEIKDELAELGYAVRRPQ